MNIVFASTNPHKLTEVSQIMEGENISDKINCVRKQSK